MDRSWLAETLWPETEKASALYNLRRNLTELRKMLGDEASRLLSPTPHSLRFDLSNAICDVVEFEKLEQRNDSEALQKAIGLYQGELLEGCREEWLLPERAVYDRKYLRALERMAEIEEGCCDLIKASEWLKRLVAREPLREDAHRRLMEILGELADFPGVERQYRELQKHLRNELNLDPTAETTELYQRLRLNSKLPQGASPKATLVASSLLKAHLKSADNLPHPLTKLIGREKDLRELSEKLLSMRMVTLTGTGGVGKTRLAIALGQEMKSHYPDGVWFVNIAHLQQEEAIAQAIAVALSIRLEAESASEALIRFLQKRKSLLILDNCEQAAEACAKLASLLLNSCHLVTLLSTSRQPLHVPGERLCTVTALQTPSDPQTTENLGDYVHRIRDYDSVVLLLDRINAVSPSFKVTNRNAQEIARICRHLDGLPLALELAAVCFRSLSAQEIAGRLEDRFRLLVSGNPENPRHKTLRAMLDWSYEQLSESEIKLLLTLSICEGGCTLTAMEAISISTLEESEAYGVIESLSRLIDCSLVFFEDRTGTPRYLLLETVQVYCREKLELRPDQTSRLGQAHALFYLDIIVTQGKLSEYKNPIACHRIADEELGNILAAFKWSWKHGDRAHAALALSILNHYWYSRCLAEEGRHQINRALEFREEYDSDVLGELLSGAGTLAYALGNLVEAEERFLQSLNEFRDSGKRSASAYACNDLAILASERRDYALAKKYLAESLALFQEEKELEGVVYTLTLIGRELATSEDYLKAIDALQEAIGIANRNGIMDHLAFSLASLGYCQNCVHQYSEAKETLKVALALCREQGHLPGIASASANLGLSHLYMKENEEAQFHWNEARTIWEEQDDTASILLYKPQFEL